MNDNTRQYSEYVLRRLEEPLRLFGQEVPPAAWLVLLIAIVQVGFIYIGVMYGREAKGGRWLWAGLMAILHAAVFGAFAFAFNQNSPDGVAWKYCAAMAVVFSGLWGLGALVLLVASREPMGERAGWAAGLGLLRASVYVFIAIIFLLPARQDWEESKRESKVVVVMDVSGSISATVDDLPDENTPIEKLLTRQDKVLTFLNNPKVNFFPRLEEKNPVTAYRFGRSADLDFRLHTGGRFYTREQWEKRAEIQARGDAPHPGYALQPEFLDVWMKPERPKLPMNWVRPEFRGPIRERLKLDDSLVLRDEVVRGSEDFLKAEDILPEHKEDFVEWKRQLAENRKQSQNGMYTGTAVGESLSALMRREMNNMVQGVVVFTDGRSTEGAAQAYRDLAEMAKRSKIPMFVVGVGSERQMVSIDIADLRVPPQIRPEDKFRTVVALTGAGMDNEPAPRFDGDPDEKKGIKGPRGYQVALDISRISRDKDGKEKNEPIQIVTLDKDGEPTKDPPISLGDEITLTQDWAKPSEFVKVTKDIDDFRKEKEVRFKPSTTGAPASAQVEFEIEAEVLMRAAGKEMAEGTRYGFLPDPNSELRFRVRVPKDRREIMTAREHLSDPADVRVLKRPLRVLLFASSATREYQFLRSLFVREMDKSRAEVCIHLQPLPDTQVRTGRVQDVPPERMLPEFPTKMDADPAAKPEERFQALSSYDVIIAFDVDFTRLTREQVANVQKWVDQKGGGLIVVGGAINTVQMTRPVSREAMEPILTLLPVILDDERIHIAERRTDRPFRLTFPGATPDMEFLKLYEPGDKDDKVTEDEEKRGDVVASWNRFFNTYETETGKVDVRDNPETVPYRGFFSVYPSKRVKDNAIMVASFADPTLRMPNGKDQPYLAMNSYGKGKVVWLGSGELWRLRSYRENWHDRFWIKLARAVGGGSLNTASRRIVPVMSRFGIMNKAQMFEAKFENRDGQPLPRDTKEAPVLTVTLPPGVLVQRGDRVKITKSGEFANKEGRVIALKNLEGKNHVTVEITQGDTRKEVQVLDNEVEIVIPPLAMRPKLGTDNDGWFDVEFQPKASGEYKLTLTNPDTGDTYLHKFIVKESNPELDNVKPDFELMYALASDADPVLARVNDETRKDLRERLGKPKLSTKDSARKDIEKEKEEALKLYFDLNNADLIPRCMEQDSKTLRNRGPVKDLWDDGPVIWDFGTTDKPPIKLPVLLLVIVGLLSVEWLTRKLLRMA